MAWSTPKTWNVGDVLTASDMDTYVRDNTNFLYQRPYILAYNSVLVSVPNSSVTPVTLGTVLASGYGLVIGTGGTANKAVIPIAGIYHIAFAVQLAGSGGSGGNYLVASVQQNGSGTINGATVPTYMSFPGSAGSGLANCAVNDTISVVAFQTSGGAINTQTGQNTTFLHVSYVGPS